MTKTSDAGDRPSFPWLFSSRAPRRVPEAGASTNGLTSTGGDRVARGEETPYRLSLPHPHRHQQMQDRYGFGLFGLPPLRETRIGRWRLVRHLQSLGEGYASGIVIEPYRYVLYENRTPWMSSGLMELESHAWHVDQASGLVVAIGLGMGLFAHACCMKREVEQVLVVEREPEVVALVRQATSHSHWPGAHKLSVVVGDGLSPEAALARAGASFGENPAYVFVDIWSSFNDPEAPAETAEIVAQLQPQAAGWWGQELAFGLWCRRHRLQPSVSALRQFGAQVNVPIPATEGYLAFCGDVMDLRLPSEFQGRDRVRRWLSAKLQKIR